MTESPAPLGETRRPFLVPPVLLARGIETRPQRQEDYTFLSHLYISVRWEEMQAAPWTDAQRLSFLEDQHSRQYRHYAEHYSKSDFLIVERGGTPIGRLCIDRGHATNLRIVDIALLPEARGAGIGSALMQAIMEEARYQAKKTSIHVEQENRAKRLYERLGFRPVTQTGPYWLMEARTDSADI